MIEKRFEQVKTVHEIAPVFLKNEGRIEALFTLYAIALLVQALIERELRQAMAREGVEAFRTRKYLHISGFANRVGSAFARLLPQRFTTSLVAAQYRNALKKQSPAQ